MIPEEAVSEYLYRNTNSKEIHAFLSVHCNIIYSSQNTGNSFSSTDE